jgi:TonB family protein
MPRTPGGVAVVLALVSMSFCPAQSGPRSDPASYSQLFIPRAAFLKAAKVPPLPVCPAEFDDSLETNGIVPEGIVRGVTLPKPLHTTEAEFSDKARMEINRQGLRPFQSISAIELVVDTDGNPRDLCVKHSSPFDLDREAAKAIWQYRFEPATKDGQPVAKRIAVEIRFAIR